MSSQNASSDSEDVNPTTNHSQLSHDSENSPLPNDTTPTELSPSVLSPTEEIVPGEQHHTEEQPDPFELLTEAIHNQAADDAPGAENKLYSTTFPIARVKTIMRTDPDTSLLQGDAVYLVGEAAKLFLSRFSRDVQRITAGNKRKTVSRQDVDTCLNRYHEYEFLDEQLNW